MSLGDVPGLCLGGNVFGWTADRAASFAVLDAALDAGLSFVDSADVYSSWVDGNEGGESEALLGAWMAERGVRDRVTVATKVGMWDRRPGLSAETIRAACEDSLRRLHTDRIDLYYAHRDDPDTPLEETLAAFDALVTEGKVRAVGLSNYAPDRLREAVAACEVENLVVPEVLQPGWSLADRSFEADGGLAACTDLGLSTLPYSALASGFLTGKYRPGGDAVDSPRAGGAAKLAASERGQRILTALDDVAAAHDDAPVAAVALAWLRAQPTVLAPIASARTVEQVAPLAASLAVTLRDDELAALDAL